MKMPLAYRWEERKPHGLIEVTAYVCGREQRRFPRELDSSLMREEVQQDLRRRIHARLYGGMEEALYSLVAQAQLVAAATSSRFAPGHPTPTEAHRVAAGLARLLDDIRALRAVPGTESVEP